MAAVGDLHASEDHRDRLALSLAEAARDVDVILLAGDLTTHGLPEEASVLADGCRGLPVPVVAVLGNHDHHAARGEEIVACLEEAGAIVLERDHRVLELAGLEVGIVGVKGFVGGFTGAEIPDFGEPLLREVYAETGREVEALEAGLEAIAGCDRRLVLLHYAPVSETVVGEPEGIWAFLGSGRMAVPVGAHRPDVVFHGHAHHGRPSGAIGAVPVYNVARPVIDGDFLVLDL